MGPSAASPSGHPGPLPSRQAIAAQAPLAASPCVPRLRRTSVSTPPVRPSPRFSNTLVATVRRTGSTGNVTGPDSDGLRPSIWGSGNTPCITTVASLWKQARSSCRYKLHSLRLRPVACRLRPQPRASAPPRLPAGFDPSVAPDPYRSTFVLVRVRLLVSHRSRLCLRAGSTFLRTFVVPAAKQRHPLHHRKATSHPLHVHMRRRARPCLQQLRPACPTSAAGMASSSRVPTGSPSPCLAGSCLLGRVHV
ncbi:hypothetical protein ZWY2020_003780 [Hordeum vulgare]|nr:hypothetical protein ZWY2020_003780 [Hordeum vulgare]